MNISCILLLSLGVSFALLYGLVISIGWAITRKNRKDFHHSVGLTEIELFDLNTWKPLNRYIKSVSLINNVFQDENGAIIKSDNFACYIVENESPDFPKIKKNYLIFLNPKNNRISYAFKVPDLKNYR